MDNQLTLSLRERLTGKVLNLPKKKSWTIPGGSGLYRILESFAGAFQRNIEVNANVAAANWAVFACVKLIANDIAKLPPQVMAYSDKTLVWQEAAGFPTLTNPNGFQSWTDFMRVWMYSLLLRGNTYVLPIKDRATGNITAMYILDPNSVRPLVTPSGDVYYRIGRDPLSQLEESVVVPANKIMHDRINPFYHPLVGLSPLYACGLAAVQGIEIQKGSTQFFMNASRPGGILTAPGEISDETAARLKAYWDENFTGDVTGKIAVLGDDLKYQALSMTAQDSQLIEQLKFTGEMICATFGVPSYKIGLGQLPAGLNLAALNQQYFDQCLHPLISSVEYKLDAGLEVFFPRQIWLNVDELLRMDQAARGELYKNFVTAGVMAPNEARRKEQMPPVPGGESPYLQQQNYSLAALAKRDAKPDPFETAPKTPPAITPPPDDTPPDDNADANKSALREEDMPMYTAWFDKQLEVTRGG